MIFKNIPTWIIHVEKSLRAALQDVEVKMMNYNDRLRNELVENTTESVAKLEKKVEEKAEASKKVILDQVEDGFSQVQAQNKRRLTLMAQDKKELEDTIDAVRDEQ